MHPAAKELLDAFIAQDDARPRSKSGFGVSLLGGCARRAYYELTKAPKTNRTKRLSAILGTLFHAGVEALDLDGFQELETELPLGIIGHVDRYQEKDGGTVTDWKFPKLASIRYVRSYGPSRQYRWQVHTYAYGLASEDLPVGRVRIVFVPRDGHDDDIYVFEEDYDPAVAEEALAWAEDIMTNALHGGVPLPEKPEPFCRDFCPFYGELCRGVAPQGDEELVQDDPWVERAAQELLEASEQRKRAEARKYDAAAILEGAVGRYGRYLVSWKRTSAGTYYPVVRMIEDVQD